MELIRSARLPQRLTQMYADTKRSYEDFVQTNEITSPKLFSLNLKLRIQKDRLFAWGLVWGESGATISGDIDGSLDRAGISDLVASIMSSINDLLAEAESMQPRRIMEAPGAFPREKATGFTGRDIQWSPQNFTRLEGIVKDITTSIDTLCDLSRTQKALRGEFDAPGEPQSSSKGPVFGFEKGDRVELPLPQKSAYLKDASSPPGISSSTRLYPNQIRIPVDKVVPRSLPPSYESVAAGSEDRVFAYLIISTSSEQGMRQSPNRNHSEKAVLLDYGVVQDYDTFHAQLPSLRRYEDLVLALQSSQPIAGNSYTRTMKIVGWFEDPRRLRYVFVYEVPDPPLGPFVPMKTSSLPHTLLSYLQKYSADTDSSNMPSLEDRYRLALNIASIILHLHAKGLTHRNINSHNVFFFIGQGTPTYENKPWKFGVIRHPFITSFDQCDEDAPIPHDEPFMSSIYRHPHIERGQRAFYRSAHDIYSLGLILLEIGLWMPIHKLWKPKYARLDFKSRLQSVYIKKLAAKCGSTYMRVVDYCLRAADPDSQSHKNPERDSRKSQHPIKLHTDYYWKAIRPLERCCSIDDLEEPGARSGTSAAAEAEIPRTDLPSSNAEIEHSVIPPSSGNKIQKDQPSVISEDTKPPQQPKRGKLKVWSHEVPLPCAKHWSAIMLPELERILKRTIDRWESCSIDLFMAGETAELARPTIYMMCASVQKVRKALQHVNREKELFDIKVVSGQISRSKAGRKKRRGKKDDKSPKNASKEVVRETLCTVNPYYQERPACGASIGAYLDMQHLPPVSFGGTVLVNGEPYGMSVHHMLENDDDLDLGLDKTVNLQKSMANASPVTFNENITVHTWCPEPLPEALYPFEMSEDEEDEYQSSADEDDSWLFDDNRSLRGDDDDDVDKGDTLGIKPSEGKDLIVTQPAIDDVNGGFFPNEEDMDEDHLSSHSFGHIHASSGIRRVHRGSISHEIDWALIKVNEDRLRETNVVTGGALHCKSKSKVQAKTLDREAVNTSSIHESASYPCQVVKADELGGLKVHALGRTSGLQTGVILPAMTLVRMPGRVSFSHSWQVKGTFGVGGDSGAWVMDNASGRVCAHVLAWSPRNNMAYIAPMEVLLDDMAQTIGGKLTLPQQESAPISQECAVVDGGYIAAIRDAILDIKEEDYIFPIRSAEKQDAMQHGSMKLPPRKPVPNTSSPPGDLPLRKPLKRNGPFSAERPETDSRNFLPSSPYSESSTADSTPSPTPSPNSPPVATSPFCLPLIDNIAQQRFPRTDLLRTISTTYTPPQSKGTIYAAPQSRREMLDGGVEGKAGGKGGVVGIMGRVKPMGGRGVETNG